MTKQHDVRALKFKSLPGLSEQLLQHHHSVLYAGYVNKLNEIEQKLDSVDRNAANSTYSEYRSLKLEETFAADAIKLHEGYFACLGGDGEPVGDALDLINAEFGSYDNWRTDFEAAGMVARGWVVLAYDLDWNRLHNYIMDAHNHGDIWTAIPVLIMDMYEHAYHLDYGADKKSYIKAFFSNINWQHVNNVLEEFELIGRIRKFRAA